jgi:hypothetical protein
MRARSRNPNARASQSSAATQFSYDNMGMTPGYSFAMISVYGLGQSREDKFHESYIRGFDSLAAPEIEFQWATLNASCSFLLLQK